MCWKSQRDSCFFPLWVDRSVFRKPRWSEHLGGLPILRHDTPSRAFSERWATPATVLTGWAATSDGERFLCKRLPGTGQMLSVFTCGSKLQNIPGCSSALGSTASCNRSRRIWSRSAAKTRASVRLRPSILTTWLVNVTTLYLIWDRFAAPLSSVYSLTLPCGPRRASSLESGTRRSARLSLGHPKTLSY